MPLSKADTSSHGCLTKHTFYSIVLPGGQALSYTYNDNPALIVTCLFCAIYYNSWAVRKREENHNRVSIHLSFHKHLSNIITQQAILTNDKWLIYSRPIYLLNAGHHNQHTQRYLRPRHTLAHSSSPWPLSSLSSISCTSTAHSGPSADSPEAMCRSGWQTCLDCPVGKIVLTSQGIEIYCYHFRILYSKYVLHGWSWKYDNN